MTGTVKIVRGFVNSQKPRKPLVLANSRQLLAPARDDLMNITLVADIPDQLVFGNVIDFMQSQRQLHDAQRRGQMAAGLGNSLGQINADFLGQHLHLLGI